MIFIDDEGVRQGGGGDDLVQLGLLEIGRLNLTLFVSLFLLLNIGDVT